MFIIIDWDQQSFIFPHASHITSYDNLSSLLLAISAFESQQTLQYFARIPRLRAIRKGKNEVIFST